MLAALSGPIGDGVTGADSSSVAESVMICTSGWVGTGGVYVGCVRWVCTVCVYVCAQVCVNACVCLFALCVCMPVSVFFCTLCVFMYKCVHL